MSSLQKKHYITLWINQEIPLQNSSSLAELENHLDWMYDDLVYIAGTVPYSELNLRLTYYSGRAYLANASSLTVPDEATHIILHLSATVPRTQINWKRYEELREIGRV